MLLHIYDIVHVVSKVNNQHCNKMLLLNLHTFILITIHITRNPQQVFEDVELPRDKGRIRGLLCLAVSCEHALREETLPT